MQFERFYSLNDSVVGSFPHLHYLGFQQTLPNQGNGDGGRSNGDGNNADDDKDNKDDNND